MTFREAYRLARNNAAALVEAMDLEQLFGGDDATDGNEEQFAQAQQKVVEFLRLDYRAASPPVAPKEKL